MPHNPTRFPFAPIHAAAGYPNLLALARTLNVTSRTVHRWKHNGLTWLQADRAATRLGHHPSFLWPEWWDLELGAELQDSRAA